MSNRGSRDREGRFAVVYDSADTDLLRFVCRRVRLDEAEDVVADVLTVAWRRFDELPTELDEARARLSASPTEPCWPAIARRAAIER